MSEEILKKEKEKRQLYVVAYKKHILNVKSQMNIKVKEWEMVDHSNRNQKEAGVVLLMSDKADFRASTITRIEMNIAE